MTAPTREDFDRWKEDRVTRYIFRACEAFAEEQHKEWDRVSWTNGGGNPLMLAELRTRADAYRALFETGYDGWIEANGDEEPKK